MRYHRFMVTGNRFLRAFGITTVILWVFLISVWLAANTIVAVEKGVRAWEKLTEDEQPADTWPTVTGTSLTDTMSTD